MPFIYLCGMTSGVITPLGAHAADARLVSERVMLCTTYIMPWILHYLERSPVHYGVNYPLRYNWCDL